MDDLQMNESIFYLETYGNHALLVAFYQRNGYLTKGIQYIIENVSQKVQTQKYYLNNKVLDGFIKKCSTDIFIESLLVPCLRNGSFFQLLELMLSLEKHQNKLYSYYGSIGKYLEKNTYLNTLYEFQLLMKVMSTFKTLIQALIQQHLI